MWLLDVNVDLGVATFLRGQGIACESAAKRGWSELTNGDLVAVATESGFETLLTRDRRFSESASKALSKNDSFAIVVLVLRQQPSTEYLDDFKAEWTSNPIAPLRVMQSDGPNQASRQVS